LEAWHQRAPVPAGRFPGRWRWEPDPPPLENTQTPTEMVDGKVQLEAVFSFTAFAREDAGIVDENVQTVFDCSATTFTH